MDTALNNINKYKSCTLEKYVIMPNHIHLILLIENYNLLSDISQNQKIASYQCGRPMVAPTVAKIINQFKGYVSKQIGFSIWQKSYYDHIIRNETDYLKIWQYIDENSLKWIHDRYYVNP